MKIYCSGIGGIGLSAYASLMNALGHAVLGSDATLTPLTCDLSDRGITIFNTQDGTNVPPDADLFVYSEAIPCQALERKHAEGLGIRQLSYFAALGELSSAYRSIAVCGTHGKSSTTAMAAMAMIDAGLDPTVIVGTKVPQMQGRNWRKGDSNLFLMEACEYRRSFLHLLPSVIVMTNVDGDHFDAFETLDAYRAAFSDFITLLPKDGVLITHCTDSACAALAEASGRRVIDADAFALPKLSLPGAHMRRNAQLVSALCDYLGIDARKPLQEFTGTWRRMELKGYYSPKSSISHLQSSISSIPIIDDYAHHPTEIVATIAAMREAYPGKRMVCLFQPHMHDRTLRLYDDFLSAFDGVDIVVTTDVYDARPDAEGERVDMKKFTADIHADAMYGGTLSAARKLLCSRILQQNDVLIVMGAGDVTKVAEEMVETSNQ